MRRDQSCKLTETAQLKKVESLENTYRYLSALTTEERATTLNRFIFQGLRKQEQEARIDSAPKFCDEPGIGLPEPDPPIPARPQNL
jgi:hypothetical protein